MPYIPHHEGMGFTALFYKGGIFSVLRSICHAGLGGTSASGKQYVSWIHGDDFIRSLEYIIENDDFSGAINICSPNPIPNEQFMKIIRESIRVPIGLPTAEWMLEIGAFFMKSETELLLKSRKVIPKRLLDHGFQFQFKKWSEAVFDLTKK